MIPVDQNPADVTGSNGDDAPSQQSRFPVTVVPNETEAIGADEIDADEVAQELEETTDRDETVADDDEPDVDVSKLPPYAERVRELLRLSGGDYVMWRSTTTTRISKGCEVQWVEARSDEDGLANVRVRISGPKTANYEFEWKRGMEKVQTWWAGEEGGKRTGHGSLLFVGKVLDEQVLP